MMQVVVCQIQQVKTNPTNPMISFAPNLVLTSNRSFSAAQSPAWGFTVPALPSTETPSLAKARARLQN